MKDKTVVNGARDPIIPVILCGGSGTRLWPLSRQSYPKQFTRLQGEGSLFQAAALRLQGNGFAPPIVVTSEAFRFIVMKQLADIGVTDATVLIEPEPRNTAPAVLAAAAWASAAQPGATLIVMPSDHVIAPREAFRAQVRKATATLDDRRIVTFGIPPTHPATGFGWIELGAPGRDWKAQRAAGFAEKPDAATAAGMLRAGSHVWNSGLFLFRATAMLTAARVLAPDLAAGAAAAVAAPEDDLGFLRLDRGPWSSLPSISIDRAIMERAPELWVHPWSGHWADLGNWEAVRLEGPMIDGGTVTTGTAVAIGCENSLLRSEAEGVQVVGLGLSDTLVVATPDAVLVADRSRAEDVGRVVDTLRSRGAEQATQAPRDHRPWGWFETLVEADRFKVKRIVVDPGGRLSLQSHAHRAEHWVVVQGMATVSIDGRAVQVAENQSIYVPCGARHRLENQTVRPVVLIEVQTGDYLGEDDITRFDDQYNRDDTTGRG